MQSKFYFIYGPMFSGKSSKLMAFINNCHQKHICVNHKFDNRYGEGKIISHDKKEIKSFVCQTSAEFLEIYNNYKPESIFIDEIQFFPFDFIEILKPLGCRVYFAGLDKDFRKNYFKISELILKDCFKLPQFAICKCGEPALYSCLKNKVENNILIGASNYEPCCDNCYY